MRKRSPRILKEQITGIAQAARARRGGAGAHGSPQALAEKGAMGVADPTNNAPRDHRTTEDHARGDGHRRQARYRPAAGAGGGDHRRGDVDKNAELGINWAAFSKTDRTSPPAPS